MEQQRMKLTKDQKLKIIKKTKAKDDCTDCGSVPGECHPCFVCGDDYCLKCWVEEFEDCGQCQNADCGKLRCNNCQVECEDCGATACEDCTQECDRCGNSYCADSCLDTHTCEP